MSGSAGGSRMTPGARFALRLVVGVGLLALILSRMGLPTIGRGLGPGTLAGDVFLDLDFEWHIGWVFRFGLVWS